MKKILYILIVLIFNSYSVNADEAECNTALKKFSEKNKTLDQSFKNVETTIKKKLKKN